MLRKEGGREEGGGVWGREAEGVREHACGQIKCIDAAFGLCICICSCASRCSCRCMHILGAILRNSKQFLLRQSYKLPWD